MSGGSHEYAYAKVAEFGEEMRRSSSTLRRAFGKHLQAVSDAMYAIEWVDSGDYAAGEEIDDIKKALGESWSAQVIAEIVSQGRDLLEELTRLLEKAEEKKR